jgi:hypothetical protein
MAMKQLTEKSKRERLFLALDIDPKQFAEYEDTIWLGRSPKELTPEQISQAVVVMTTILNLSSGNSGGRNLYKLNQLYLLNDAATNDLNEVLMKYQAVIFNH